MNIVSRFQTRPDCVQTVCLSVDGECISAQKDDSVAAALLAASGDAMRYSSTGLPGSAYCMMGVCFNCLVEIDGCSDCQACMVTVREGMIVRRQQGLRKLIVKGLLDE